MEEKAKLLPIKVLKKMSLKEFIEYAETVIKPMVSKRKEGFAIRFPYALNCSPDEKNMDCSPYYEYTAFINNGGNLVHLCCSEDPDFLLRVKFRYSIKHLSKRKQHVMIWERIHLRINAGKRPE